MDAKPILIIEDDDEILHSLREALEDEGYPVKTAMNGRDALTMLARGALPGLILLDLMMPVMDGWQFLDAIHEDIPIIVTSGYVHDAKSMAAAALIRRPAGFMTKPLDLNTILQLADAYCRPAHTAAHI